MDIRFAIVGCGGMGHRHLTGLAELERADLCQFKLVGACDPVRANAASLADQAAAYFGRCPIVALELELLVPLVVEAIDMTATPRFHHAIVFEALERGWHTMIEKPVRLTVRACTLLLEAAAATACVVSLAENYRRDPLNRLAAALLQASVIGTSRLLIDQSIGGGDRMLISMWRDQKDQSGVLLDVGVQFTDMMEYLLGPIDTVYAQTRLHTAIRTNPAAGGGGVATNPSGVYGRWQKEMPAVFVATTEVAAYATMTFRSGLIGQYVEDHAGHGQEVWAQQIFGSTGAMMLPNDRSGDTLRLQRDG